MEKIENRFDLFIRLLLSYNKTHKLTGAKNKDEVLFHIKDSLFPFEKYDFSKQKNILDVGTGAGFPGMVLAIKYPQKNFFLVEPLQKRVAFLYLVKSSYNLQNVKIFQNRVEELEAFDVDLITSKAVCKVDLLLKLTQKFCHKDLIYLFYKGKNFQEEVKNIHKYEIIKNNSLNYLIIKDLQC